MAATRRPGHGSFFSFVTKFVKAVQIVTESIDRLQVGMAKNIILLLEGKCVSSQVHKSYYICNCKRDSGDASLNIPPVVRSQLAKDMQHQSAFF